MYDETTLKSDDQKKLILQQPHLWCKILIMTKSMGLLPPRQVDEQRRQRAVPARLGADDENRVERDLQLLGQLPPQHHHAQVMVLRRPPRAVAADAAVLLRALRVPDGSRPHVPVLTATKKPS